MIDDNPIMKKNSQKNEKKQEYESLLRRLETYDYHYFVLDKPLITDEEYDELYLKLKNIEKAFPSLISPDSPTQRVGGKALDLFEKIPHRTPMLSLQNVFSPEEARAFDKKIKRKLLKDSKLSTHSIESSLSYYCEPKLDGLAVELIYENNLLIQALTRGDGILGENVILNIKTLKSIPLRLKSSKTNPKRLEVRGEVLMLKKDFHLLNEENIKNGDVPFSNPRNAVAGAIRQLDPRVASKRPMRMYCYTSGLKSDFNVSSQKELIEKIQNYNLPCLSHSSHLNDVNLRHLSCLTSSIEEVILYHKKMNELREKLPFLIDGIVAKVNDFSLQEALGETNKGPRWAFAFKFKSKTGITKIKDIIVRVGRTGVLTPVAIMEPLKLGGATIKQATLHNQDEVRRKDIRVGDHVFIHRAGDVIPAVLRVIKEKRISFLKRFLLRFYQTFPFVKKKHHYPMAFPFSMPKFCPSCKEKVEKTEGEVFLKCMNPLCPSVIKESLKHFVSRKAMNIDHLGDKIIEKLVDTGRVKTFSMLYKLKIEDLISLEKLGPKSSAKIFKNIKESLSIQLWRFIYAWGIPSVGEVMARSLAQHFGSLENFLSSTEEDLLKLKFIGRKVARSINRVLNQDSFLKELKEFKNLGLKIKNSPSMEFSSNEDPKPLQDLTFVVTGEFKLKRDEIHRLIEKHGGRSSSSVSKKTSYLLASQLKGKKYEKALALKIRILSWNDFKKMISDL